MFSQPKLSSNYFSEETPAIVTTLLKSSELTLLQDTTTHTGNQVLTCSTPFQIKLLTPGVYIEKSFRHTLGLLYGSGEKLFQELLGFGLF